jgi:predicted nucleotidyltransferase
MITRRAISAFAQRIAEEFRPTRIILFGSYAYGKPTPDSDVDLMVIMPYRGHPAYKAIEILRKLAPPFAIDLMVRTPAELRWRVQQGDFFLRDVVEKGKVLYEASDRRVGRQSGARLSKRRARDTRA